MEEIFLEIKLDLKEELKNFSNKDNQYTIPIFIPHKGCPNNCIFCNQRSKHKPYDRLYRNCGYPIAYRTQRQYQLEC